MKTWHGTIDIDYWYFFSEENYMYSTWSLKYFWLACVTFSPEICLNGLIVANGTPKTLLLFRWADGQLVHKSVTFFRDNSREKRSLSWATLFPKAFHSCDFSALEEQATGFCPGARIPKRKCEWGERRNLWRTEHRQQQRRAIAAKKESAICQMMRSSKARKSGLKLKVNGYFLHFRILSEVRAVEFSLQAKEQNSEEQRARFFRRLTKRGRKRGTRRPRGLCSWLWYRSSMAEWPIIRVLMFGPVRPSTWSGCKFCSIRGGKKSYSCSNATGNSWCDLSCEAKRDRSVRAPPGDCLITSVSTASSLQRFICHFQTERVTCHLCKPVDFSNQQVSLARSAHKWTIRTENRDMDARSQV